MKPKMEIIFIAIIAMLFCATGIVLIMPRLNTFIQDASSVSNPAQEQRVFPATWTPKPTLTSVVLQTKVVLPTSSPVPTQATLPTVEIPPLDPWDWPKVEFNSQNYPVVYNPLEVGADPYRFQDQRFQVTLYVLRVDENGDSGVKILMGTEPAGQLTHYPVVVYGFTSADIEQNWLVTVFGIGWGTTKITDPFGEEFDTTAIWGEHLFVVCSSRFGCQ